MYNVAVVGATGVVGQKMIDILTEYKFPIAKLRLFASNRSAGKKVVFNGETIVVERLIETSLDTSIDVALFSAGGAISKKFAPIAAANNIVVIDNSSTFRMTEDVPLVVPEINAASINLQKNKIIANPNCSTIQSVLPLAPFVEKVGIQRIDYTTYQAVSGAGQQGIDDYLRGAKGELPQKMVYPIYNNLIPQIDDFLPNGYTKEEEKMVNETQKILGQTALPISATCIRVPIINCHTVDIRVEFTTAITLTELKRYLTTNAAGVIVYDDPATQKYPMPIIVDGQDAVYVGRIRQDLFDPCVYHFVVVGDNIRKGAASNAVQIAQYLHKTKQLGM